MPSSFLVLYRGPTIPQAKLVAVSSDPALVAEFADRLLRDHRDPLTPDPVLGAIEGGRQRALRLIARGQGDDRHDE